MKKLTITTQRTRFSMVFLLLVGGIGMVGCSASEPETNTPVPDVQPFQGEPIPDNGTSGETIKLEN